MEAVLDIETDKVDATKIRLVGVAWMEGDTLRKKTATKASELADILLHLNPTALIGHNIIAFDAKHLQNLWGIDITEYPLIDTLIMSKLADFNRKSHSLESYGTQLGYPKGTISCYATAPISELAKYLYTDLELSYKVYKKLLSQFSALNKDGSAIAREMEVAEIMLRQREAGIVFDTYGAEKLLLKLDMHLDSIRYDVNPGLGRVLIPASRLKKPPLKQFKADGCPSALAIRYFPTLCYNKAIKKYCFIHPESGKKHYLPHHMPINITEPLTLDMTSALKNWLLAKGWKPTLWNTKKVVDATTGRVTYTKTSPKLYNKAKEPCPGLAKCGFGLAEEVATFFTVRSRRNVIKSEGGTGGWLNNPRVVSGDGKLTADADTMGANTGRFTHRIVANVPRVTSLYGKEMRELFKPSKGKVMVGWDASSLEACMEGHYCIGLAGGKEHVDRLMSGSIHDRNAELLGCSRDKAKEFKYAITYGAQPATLAETMGWSLPRANKAYSLFWDTNKVLASLKSRLASSWKLTGCKYIRGIDGRKIFTRSEHSLMNALFQSAGAIVMKEAMVIADRKAHSTIAGCTGLIRYHDEEQWECDADDAHRLGLIGTNSITQAGINLDMKVKLKGAYKVGDSWADTH